MCLSIYRIIALLVVPNQLPSRDRLHKLGVVFDMRYVLCDFGCDFRDHLFFECQYVRDIWSSVHALCVISRNIAS
ncbi:hypothetical protein GQ457_09G027270 [Hibiscus cannabinus]